MSNPSGLISSQVKESPQQQGSSTSMSTTRRRRRCSTGAGFLLAVRGSGGVGVDADLMDCLEAESKSTSRRIRSKIQRLEKSDTNETTNTNGQSKLEEDRSPDLSTAEGSSFQVSLDSQGSSVEETTNSQVNCPINRKVTSFGSKTKLMESSSSSSQFQQNSLLKVPVFDKLTLRQEWQELFGSNSLYSQSLTAKIFAVSSLWINQSHPELKSYIRSTCFLSMLQSFVNVETTIINHSNETTDNSLSTKRVRFCTLSSITPPTDIRIGSHRHQERCIEALRISVEKMEDLYGNCAEAEYEEHKEQTEGLLKCFEQFIFTLRSIEESSRLSCRREEQEHNDNDFYLDFSYHEVAHRYRIEMEEMHAFISLHWKASTDAKAKPYEETFRLSPTRRQLGEQIGAAIRFHLRRLFNPVPLTPTNTDSTKLPQGVIDYSNCRSRAHQLVRMVAGSGDRDTAAADGVISSVFNLAIRYIYNYFDFSSAKLVDSDFTALTLGDDENDESKNIINGTKSGPEFDVSPILDCIQRCHEIIATGKACKFVTDLLDWPGIMEAINDVGGLEPIEKLASLLKKHNLSNICPEVAHFQILNDIQTILEKLRLSKSCIDETTNAVEGTLRALWKRFNCGARKRARSRRNPFVVLIKDAILADEADFPSLESAQEEYVVSGKT